MKVRLFASMALVLVLVMSSGMLVQAMEPPGFPEGVPWEEQPWFPPGPGSAWQMLAAGHEELVPQDTGGPDDFGYTWDDSVPMNWIEATGGTKLEFARSVAGPVDIGFPFKFYENTYAQLWVSQDGFLSFDPNPWFNYERMPSPALPNNLIAPYRAWLEATGEGSTPMSGVYVLRGGQAPVRYLVVQWQDMVSQVGDPSDYDVLTFQAVLYESGDILLQYRDMRYRGISYSCVTVGMEDSAGLDGLVYGANRCVPDKVYGGNAAVFIRRPPASARLGVLPLYDGSFTHPGGEVSYALTVRNTGELGADVYDVSLVSFWPAALYAQDGVTPLADSDGDGAPDTGVLLQGGSATVVVKVQAPAGAVIGENNAAQVKVTSSLNTGKSKTATLRTAVPAPFAQAYTDSADGAVILYLSLPVAQAGRQVAPGTGEVAVAEMPGGFAYFWTRGGWKGDIWAQEIWYALLDWHGELIYGPARLTNHAGAVLDTFDGAPVVAVSPDGHVGVLWARSLYSDSGSNSNIYFAVIAPSGAVAVAPTNLTNNTGWSRYDAPTYGVPTFWGPAIAATGDNRFVLAWCREHQEPPGGGCSDYCYVTDIYYTIRDVGGEVKGITRFTHDDPGGSGGNYGPNLAGLSGNRVLLSWYRDGDIYYAALDSAGNVVRGVTALTSDQWQSYDNEPKARELSHGMVIVAWAGGQWPEYQVRFAVLDGSLNRAVGPVALDNPAAVTGAEGISIATDASGRAILTWMDSQVDRNLYYALVDSNGSVLTQPMIFRSVSSPAGYIATSYYGCGNASYSWQPPVEPDGAAWFAASLVGGSPGGSAAVQVRYGNYGQQTLSAAALTLELPEGLTYLGDTSGIAPTVEALAVGPGLTAVAGGTRVSWSLPDTEFFGRKEFQVIVGLPANAQLGDRYAIRLRLTAAGDANLADNEASAEVMAAALRFLPLVFGY
jgi:hypothetical protein